MKQIAIPEVTTAVSESPAAAVDSTKKDAAPSGKQKQAPAAKSGVEAAPKPEKGAHIAVPVLCAIGACVVVSFLIVRRLL